MLKSGVLVLEGHIFNTSLDLREGAAEGSYWEVELSTAAFAATFQMLLNVYKEYVSVSRLTGNDML